MKKTTCFISLAIAALFISCSSTTDDASISLSVPREIISSVFKSSDGSESLSNYPIKKIKCTLLDKNEKEIDSQTDDIAENTNTVITFSGIPVGTKVSASATIYGSDNENSTEYSLYAGQSGKITVKPGNNTITLKLKKTTTTVVLYNNTLPPTEDIPAGTPASLSYATLTSSGISGTTDLITKASLTTIIDYCFDKSNNLYAIVYDGSNDMTPYSIKKYPYSNNAYGEATAYNFDANEVSSVNYIEAADDGTLYVIYTDANYGVWIANLDFDAPNLNSSYNYIDGNIQTFCTDGTNFYIITSSSGNGVTDVFLNLYTIESNEFALVNFFHLASTGELAGENDYPLSSYGTSLEYRDLCYINGTLYLLVNDVSTLDVTSRGALCTFNVSDAGISAGKIGIGYQTTEGSISYTGDPYESENYPTVTQPSYLGDGKSTFYGPVKFVARKEDELIIADEGYSVTSEPYKKNPSHTQGTVLSKNAVVTYNLSKETLNFATLEGEYFENEYSGYFYGSSIQY